MPEPRDVCEAIALLNRMGMWPKDKAMQGLAADAKAALATADDEEVPKPGSDAALGRRCGCFPCICNHDCPIPPDIVGDAEVVSRG